MHHRFYIRTTIKSLHINLGPATTLSIQAGFFHGNRVQRIAVEGGLQFELATDAMAGNANARLLQFDLFGISTVVLGAYAFHNELQLNVTAAETVIVREHAFNGTAFRALFSGVQELRIHEGAFAQAIAGSHLTVLDSRVEDVWPLHTSLREVRFERTHIGRLRTRAFHVAGLDAIEFRGCTIDVVEREAFTEKVSDHAHIQYDDYFILHICLYSSSATASNSLTALSTHWKPKQSPSQVSTKWN